MSKWHAPGMGEIHSEDHKIIIQCIGENDAGEEIACDKTARIVCDRLNAPTWQPIETAPKDGSTFLALRKHASLPIFCKFDAVYDWFENDDRDHVYDLAYWHPLPEFKEES